MMSLISKYLTHWIIFCGFYLDTVSILPGFKHSEASYPKYASTLPSIKSIKA